MNAERPFAWERSYPPGVSWDAPIEVSTVSALLDQGLARSADAPAFDFRDRTILYRNFVARVDRLAAAFIARGIGPGVAVGLHLPNTPWHPVAFFACMKAGARAVHMSALEAERELAHKLKDSGARVLVATNWAGLLPKALKLKESGLVDLLVVGDDAEWGPGAFPLAPVPQGEGIVAAADLIGNAKGTVFPKVSVEDVALLQYTGGTTGVPKGAMLTHANLTAAVSSYDAWYLGQGREIQGSRNILVLPLFHIYALTTILLRQVKHGNEMLLRERFDPEAILRDIEEKRATAFAGVPTMWIALANLPGIEKRDLSSLTFCGSGGASLPVEVGARFERLTGHRLGGGWGMTETAPAGTNLPLDGPGKPGSMGLPLPGIEMGIRSLDDPRQALGPNEKGEIAIRARNVMKGYWNRPQETAAAFVDGWFLTGDIGHMDEDGWFFLVDRKKDMIISGGFNVYPRVIEEAVYEHPDVEEAVVVGVPDPYRGEAAKAFVKLRAGAVPLTLEALRAFLADKIGRHEMPAALEIRDALPRTAVGKLSKKELVEEEREKARMQEAS
ncbi:MAG TPA: dicarboxylate--CoA ligase PimA [Beijerinckiaceae bacterium]